MRTSDHYVASFELAFNHSQELSYASAHIALTDARHSAQVTASDDNRTGYRLPFMGQRMGGEGYGILRKPSTLAKTKRVRALSSASRSL